MSHPGGFSILPVDRSDLSVIADFVHSSKLSLTINRLLFKDWPNEAAQKAVYTKAVESAFDDPSVEGLKALMNGEIVGYVGLTRKRPAKNVTDRPLATDEDGMPPPPDHFNPEVLMMVSNAVTEINKEMEGIDHFGMSPKAGSCNTYLTSLPELTYIHVKPSYRRRGVGSRLVQRCLDTAKSVGVCVRASSEPAAHEFFVHQGFEDTKHVDMDLARYAPPYSGFGVFRLAGMGRTGFA
jgi:GNAT superfamily N-acetyltransferase